MKKIFAATAVLAFAAVPGRAETNSALGCLQASADNGGLSACLDEPGRGASVAAPAGGPSARPAPPASLKAASSEPREKRRSHMVPTPTGYTSAEEGSLKAGFYNGLDSGFKSVFMAVEYLPVLGIVASGAPYQSNAGTFAFTALGVLLALPASILGVALGAPIGAAAGMIAEKVSPGSTNDWYTF